jgi:hypothetical protein
VDLVELVLLVQQVRLVLLVQQVLLDHLVVGLVRLVRLDL